MGCIPSKSAVSEPSEKKATKAAPASGKLLEFTRPAKYEKPSFAAAYAKAARRYGFAPGVYAGYAKADNVVVKVKSLADRSAEHEVPATSIQNGDTEYVVGVAIGTPATTLQLDFDTGSSDLWVWSSELAGVSTSGHTIYNPANSSTAKKVDRATWNISYGDGSSASGEVYTDAVQLAGITIPNQAVEVATQLSSEFQSDVSDGLLGLAWPAINTVSPQPVATPVENLIQENLINPQVFTVKLGHGTTETSFYSFGYIDETVTSNPITYTPVDNSQGFWQATSTSWSLNGSKKERSGNTAILDTGTTLCLVDDTVLKEIYDAVEGAKYDDQQGGWIYPTSAKVPEVSFAVGETLYTISATDFTFGDAGNGYSFGGIQSRGTLTFDIFGDVFLKNVYVVFDQGNTRVGLSQRDS